MRITREMAHVISSVALVAAASSPCTVFAAGAPAVPSPPPTPAAPVVRDTRGNLQDTFQNEVNTKARYAMAAAIADREGYRSVARLFRACAQSEQIHADQDVHAIAWMGDEAKAYMERPTLGTTAENLRAAIDRETYEAKQLYPAMVARARAEHQSAAVRSLTYALAAERVHATRLEAALTQLESRPAPQPIYVCGVCGMMVETVDSKRCPTCFAPARKFTSVD